MLDLLEQMRLGTAARFPVKVRQFEISLRPLTIAETIGVAAEVSDELARRPSGARNAITEHVIFSIKTLALASTSKPDAGDPRLTEFSLQNCTPDELAYLFKSYCAGVDKVNPSLETMPESRLLELLAFAKKNPSALIELSLSEVTGLCRYLLENSLADK